MEVVRCVWYLLTILIFFAPAAGAAQAYGDATDGWRPRCLNRPGQRLNVFFKWNEREKYERRIYAKLAKYSCPDWRKSWRPSLFHRWTQVARGTTSVLGVALDDETLQKLEQVRQGANRIHTEKTGEEWLANHPLARYTYDTNVWLTFNYGNGFAAEIYRAWVASRPGNADVRRRMLEKMDAFMRDPSPQETLRARSANLVVVIALGMDAERELPPGSAEAVRQIVTETPSFGVETVILKNHPWDDIPSNVGILTEQLDELLSRGKDVILVGVSKGSPELLAATANVAGPFLDENRAQIRRPAGRGKIVAYLNLVGLIGGTYLADAIERIPFSSHVGPLLAKHFRGKAKTLGQMLIQLRTMSTSRLSLFNSSFFPHLPSDTVYITVAGVMGGNGFGPTEDPAISDMRNVDRFFHWSRGANDGYIEYPKNELPASLGPKNYVLTCDSSHMVTDGHFGPYSLGTRAGRQAMFTSLYEVALDLQ